MEQQIIENIVKSDSAFNEAVFKSYVDNMFVKIFTAVMLDELESVKHFMSEDVYLQFQGKLDKLNRDNLRQMYDELNVKSTSIIDFQVIDGNYVIGVKLTSRYMDYLLNKDSGEFVRGNNQSRVERDYILTLTKKSTFLTQGMVRKCPGCGASISVNTSGVCEYCGAVYNLGDYEYILTAIVSQ